MRWTSSINKLVEWNLLNVSDLTSNIFENRSSCRCEQDFIRLYSKKSWRHIDSDFAQSIPYLDCVYKKLISNLKSNNNILIWTDYDIDGGASAAILLQFLRKLIESMGSNSKIQVHVPDRAGTGYGIDRQQLYKFIDQEYKMIFTLDCGTDEPILEEAAVLVDIVSIDHHKQQKQNQNLYLLNPHLLKFTKSKKCIFAIDLCLCDANCKICDTDSDAQSSHCNLFDLCATGLTYLFIRFLFRCSRDDGYIIKIDKGSFLDLAAMATICDVVPLRGINRLIVKEGLKTLLENPNPGIKSILNLIHMKRIEDGKTPLQIDESIFGFYIGPILNSASRMNSKIKIYELLTSLDPENMALELYQCNEKRKSIQSILWEKIIPILPKSDSPVFCLIPSEYLGINGIIAGRIKDFCNKPAFVLSGKVHNVSVNDQIYVRDDEEIIISARSPSWFDIGSAIKKSLSNGTIIKGGGHESAGGATVLGKNLSIFIEEMQKQQASFAGIKEVITVDGLLNLSKNYSYIKELVRLASPFGNKWHEPVFVIADVMSIELKKINYGLQTTLFDGEVKVRAYCFSHNSDLIYKFLENNQEKMLNFLCSISTDLSFHSIMIKDIAGSSITNCNN